MSNESQQPTFDLHPNDDGSMEDIEAGFKRIAEQQAHKETRTQENLRTIEALLKPFNIVLPHGTAVDLESVFPVLVEMIEKVDDLKQRFTDKKKASLAREDAVKVLEVARAHGLVKAPVTNATDPELLVLVLDELRMKLENIKHTLPPTGKVGLKDRGFGGD